MPAATESKAQAIARADRNEKKAKRLAQTGKHVAIQAAQNWEQILHGGETYAVALAAGYVTGRYGTNGEWNIKGTAFPVAAVAGGVVHIGAAFLAASGYEQAASHFHAGAKGALSAVAALYGVQKGAERKAEKVAEGARLQQAALLAAQAQQQPAQIGPPAATTPAATPSATSSGLTADEALAAHFASVR